MSMLLSFKSVGHEGDDKYLTLVPLCPLFLVVYVSMLTSMPFEGVGMVYDDSLPSTRPTLALLMH